MLQLVEYFSKAKLLGFHYYLTLRSADVSVLLMIILKYNYFNINKVTICNYFIFTIHC